MIFEREKMKKLQIKNKKKKKKSNLANTDSIELDFDNADKFSSEFSGFHLRRCGYIRMETTKSLPPTHFPKK